MAGLLIVLFIVIVFVGCAATTLFLVATGNWTWDEGIRRDALRMHSAGTVFGVLLSAVLLGVQATLTAWPVLVGFLAVRFGATALLDALYGVGWFRPREPRIIEHRDGRRALVDARTGQGYQRLPVGETKQPDALARWLNEKV